ncbi:diphosphate--fructose-6-phosphate 1-phosphotransferase [Entomospira culicis]|uniref:Pyrophosphate--fructose 6-phosphate 1-phosphotransferase n=1 Tax=Entomospira culicis TaxID=2719989 RepID=A0A968KU67_9SPIO|nr:diphosphate--fructose-6-phosphate 1-phosphotransferase [Entomospira culicis]NIZ18625.1 diphosphate--fructose-6-phosphate 1-phosphotransferase [Entomospira culicis]NIZ68840.1 diphosphate--fructose-6-phosphate 1-phosphotransferase [Entomospira culicis]WDI37434.1 diphosphate--fructose-6-phosphate 1-phosphotransferase [Entomospira culicis]WDI39062.1 diphosphate--fructose-6-phosphate 1-phosphotransferase [Entomospira culicis]
MKSITALQKARYAYLPKLPSALMQDVKNVVAVKGSATESFADQQAIKQLFPHTYGQPIVSFESGASSATFNPIKVGVILSGGQAPGGHNVIAGLYDGLKKANPQSQLFGFLGGPSGLLEAKYLEVTDSLMDEYRNTGGFDMIQSGRTKLESSEQFDLVLENAQKLSLDALVVIGGDDSNTNGAVLAEYFKAKNSSIQVIGCPKTIDGDLKNQFIETSFGFDTAAKTYSELIGNIARDAMSARKYWHFIKLMGRSASHIALECALQTRPNVTLISEEVEAKQMTLADVVQEIAHSVMKRAEKGWNFGIVLIPEGLVEFIPEIKALIAKLNDMMSEKADEFGAIELEKQPEWVHAQLDAKSAEVYASLPRDIQFQLILDRDPHGNVQVSLIETEKLLSKMVASYLEKAKAEGKYKGKFAPLGHFFGYEGRCAFPSNFDADYCYSLGYTSFLLIANGMTGYISSLRELQRPASEWVAGGIPLTMMMNMERRHGEMKPVIRKALVELNGKPFQYFAHVREKWAVENDFAYPGAIQYYGPTEVCDQTSITLGLEKSK